jgi:universal stress protein A
VLESPVYQYRIWKEEVAGAMIPKNILFCTDFSENSLSARECAIAYAVSFGASLTVIHVINSSQIGYPSLADEVPLDLKSALDGIRDSVTKALELIADDCSRQVKEVHTSYAMGSPAYEIVRYAKEHGIDLIVTGTHGWTGFKHLILGSTAENIVRNSTCPVLTVRSRVGATE